MEVDEIQRQVCKFQRISSNGGTTSDKSSNPQKIATHKANLEYQDDGGGGGGRFCGWPSSRIVRVSRASGGKDRHSKVLTSKGLRDRRVRLSVTTAIQFYDLQDRLGYDQPSKAVEWLLKAASASISELPSLDAAFSVAGKPTQNDAEVEDRNYSNTHNQNNNNVSMSNSSTSETSKGSGLSLSRSENRIKARERAREMAAKKEKEKETDSTRAAVVNQLNGISSFTDLLNGGISSAAVSPNTAVSPESRTHWTTPMDYFFGRAQTTHMPQFNITSAGDNHPHHQFSFLQEGFSPVVATAAAGGGSGFNRGTLQSNLSSFLPPHIHNLPRFQTLYGSTSTNFPFFMAPNSVSVAPEQFPENGYDGQRLPPCYGGGDGGGRQSDHHNDKTKH